MKHYITKIEELDGQDAGLYRRHNPEWIQTLQTCYSRLTKRERLEVKFYAEIENECYEKSQRPEKADSLFVAALDRLKIELQKSPTGLTEEIKKKVFQEIHNQYKTHRKKHPEWVRIRGKKNTGKIYSGVQYWGKIDMIADKALPIGEVSRRKYRRMIPDSTLERILDADISEKKLLAFYMRYIGYKNTEIARITKITDRTLRRWFEPEKSEEYEPIREILRESNEMSAHGEYYR